MDKIIFAFPGNEILANNISKKMNIAIGNFVLRQFPDQETYIRLLSDVAKKEVIVIVTLYQPDSKFLALYFLSKLLKDYGASKITLVVPYLSYMRQDKQFQTGEAITSKYFASLISTFADELITIDPHLHRRKTMSEIYTMPCKILHASSLISEWIVKNIDKPLLVGPDIESEQWVAETARQMNTPYIILEKIRISDNEVKISIPKTEQYSQHTPVLIDDIISTAKTMIVTVQHLKKTGMKPAVCIGVHGLFSGNAFDDLLKSGVEKIVTCNTIPHVSNIIDVSELIADSLS